MTLVVRKVTKMVEMSVNLMVSARAESMVDQKENKMVAWTGDYSAASLVVTTAPLTAAMKVGTRVVVSVEMTVAD